MGRANHCRVRTRRGKKELVLYVDQPSRGKGLPAANELYQVIHMKLRENFFNIVVVPGNSKKMGRTLTLRPRRVSV